MSLLSQYVSTKVTPTLITFFANLCFAIFKSPAERNFNLISWILHINRCVGCLCVCVCVCVVVVFVLFFFFGESAESWRLCSHGYKNKLKDITSFKYQVVTE